jgi:hypothetical protein
MADVQTIEAGIKLVPVNVGPRNLDSDRSSEDEQLLIGLLLRKMKNGNMAGSQNLKSTTF